MMRLLTFRKFESVFEAGIRLTDVNGVSIRSDIARGHADRRGQDQFRGAVTKLIGKLRTVERLQDDTRLSTHMEAHIRGLFNTKSTHLISR